MLPSQVCQLLQEGDWTTERDEDLTAPYAFMNNTWVAFEDPTSLKIKVRILIKLTFFFFVFCNAYFSFEMIYYIDLPRHAYK